MLSHYFLGSLTRISDLDRHPFTVDILSQNQWNTGDYVVGQVIPPVPPFAQVELADGRMAYLLEGDHAIGAFGIRRATLEAVGDWLSIKADHQMEDLTRAGLFGRLTSISSLLSPLTSLVYQGHITREGQKVCMQDFVSDLPERSLTCPIILIIGTSMSAGKTTAARVIIHLLKQMNLKVVGAKLTGAGRYRDILAMRDAGADHIVDFVDVGLPSSVCPPKEFRNTMRQMLSLIAAQEPDVLVAEAGASPLEPYNGAVAIEELEGKISCTVLCASDPYAVIGVSQSFGLMPDLVSGVATSTTAGIDLVEKLTGVPALRLPCHESLPALIAILKKKLAL